MGVISSLRGSQCFSGFNSTYPKPSINSMTSRSILVSTLALSLHAFAAERPNIIVIMADDLGYGDLSCYGATAFKTPHIDQLAAEGQRFTSGYC